MEISKEDYTIPINTNKEPIIPQTNKDTRYKLVKNITGNQNNITNNYQNPFFNKGEEFQPIAENYFQQNDSVSSETFYSVQSEIVILDVNQNKNLIQIENKIPTKSIISPKKTFNQPQQIKFVERDMINYGLEKEYEEMKQFLMENQFDKIREWDGKILRKEIEKRKEENKLRLENLKKIEMKLAEDNNRMAMTEKQFQFKTGSNPELNNLMFLPNVLNSNKKVDLVLANIEKGGGYRVIQQNEFNSNYDAVPFGGYVFYQKKGSEN